MNRLILAILMGFPLLLWAQDDPVLNLQEYYRLVGQNHPLAKQASLLNIQGTVAVSEARGAFDPKLISSYQNKVYQGTEYFDIWDSYINIPTFLNIDLKAGYERAGGAFVNAERTLPENGLYYAGISVPLGQGLLTNTRNINLRKGKFLKQELETEANQVLNNLFLDANFAYWWWYENFQKSEIARSNLELIIERFHGVRQGVINGENAAIDSVEALIQVQQWSNNLEKAEVDLQNSLLHMQMFIWVDSLNISGLRPQYGTSTPIPDLGTYIDYATVNHPEWRNLQIQNAIIDLDRKLKADQLKPVINLNYNLLLAENNERGRGGFLSNNYKGGFDIAFPVLLRKERAKLKMIKLKLEKNKLKQSEKLREMINKIEQNYNKIITLRSMIRQQDQMVQNYALMLQGEQIKFENGESSLFLVNARENKRLEAEIKLVELKSEYGRSVGLLNWSSGIFPETLQDLF